MCHDPDATPPVDRDATATTATTTLLPLTSADGARFAAFLARPSRPSGLGVVVLPDNRGLSRFYERLAVRLAEQGHAALAIDYFGRTAGLDVHDRGADFPFMEHLARLTKEGLYGDIAAAADHLRAGDCRAVAALGFCFGGRLAFLAAAPAFGLAGVVGFYGYPDPIGDAPGPTQLARELAAPVLGLFGGADEHIPPGAVAAFDEALAAAGVRHEIVAYPGAPHSFFELGRPEHEAACVDAWRRVLAFLRGLRASPSS